MTDLQYTIAKYMLEKPRTIDETCAHINRFRIRKIKRPVVERAIDSMECTYIIEELGKKEKERLESTGEETTGSISDWSGYYLVTEDNGLELCQEIYEENRRFYMPFVFSAIFSVLSIVISVIALLVSLS